jgi:hypothetical protein
MGHTYSPRGLVVTLLAALDAEPRRIFTSAECAQVMACKRSAVAPLLIYAVKAQRVFKRYVGKRCEYSASPMEGAIVLPPARRRRKQDPNNLRADKAPADWSHDHDDPRVPKVDPRWKPPVMRCVRLGA